MRQHNDARPRLRRLAALVTRRGHGHLHGRLALAGNLGAAPPWSERQELDETYPVNLVAGDTDELKLRDHFADRQQLRHKQKPWRFRARCETCVESCSHGCYVMGN